MPDVVIVGGGLVGASCARELALAGFRVRLVERGGRTGEAWQASAGILAPQIEVSQADPLFTLGIQGRDYYLDASAALLDATGVDIEHRASGVLQVAGSSEEAATLRSCAAWQHGQGQLSEWIEPEVLQRTRSWLAPGCGALFAPRDGSVNPVRLVEALRADALRLGAELVEDTVTALTVANGRATGAQGRSEHLAAHVVIAAGAWSGGMAGLPRPLSVEPVRGQLIAYARPSGIPDTPVFGGHCYVLPRAGELIAGSTMEHAGFSCAVTAAGIASIRARAESLVPGLRELAPLRSWAGLRPGTPDGRPIVGREPELPGLWYATGHGRNGVLYAGITGRIILDLIAERPTLPEAELLRPERFWHW